MAPQLSFAGAVLAGGASVRMGADKALLEIAGAAMVARVADALREAGADRVVVVGGDAERISSLGLTTIADQHPGAGPLGGILTALDTLSEHEAIAILACDLLDPHPPSIRAMVGAFGTGDVVVPVADGHMQWHHTAWRPATHSHLAARFEAGERAPRRAAQGLSVVELHDSAPCWYHDADRPEDLPRSR